MTFHSDSWMDRAACRGMPVAVFFPSESGPENAAKALEVCLGCPVMYECRAYADRTESASTYTNGVLGGETKKMRLHRRKVEARSAAARYSLVVPRIES